MTNETVMQLLMYLAGLVTAAIVSAFVTERVKTRLAKDKRDDEQLLEMKQEERDENLKKEVLEEVSKTIKFEIREGTKELKSGISNLQQETVALSQKISTLENNQSKQGTALCSSIRNDIKKAYDLCKEKGYRTDWDTDNLNHLFDDYKKLGGNSFVEDLMNKFHDIPLE